MATSRIGRMPVAVPAGVTCEVAGTVVKVAGPKGKLELSVPAGVNVSKGAGVMTVATDETLRMKPQEFSSRHGLVRALLQNMMVGVTKGYTRKLEMMGAGFRPTVTGNKLSLTLGFSHPVVFALPAGVTAVAEKVETGARGEERHAITLSGCDKAVVGELAATIRRVRKADAYKGKGIRYAGEVVRKKAGKAAATAAGGTGGK